MVMPGPAPSPNARRRNAQPNLTRLPANGYTGAIPEWPLPRPLKAEKEAWDSLWRLPQAVAWARMQVARTVARYVRALIVAESRESTAFQLSEVRQLEDRLGLTPMSMLRLRWEIAPDELAEARETSDERARPNLRAVE